MTPNLISQSIVSQQIDETEAKYELSINLTEHRYLYSHIVQDIAVIPTVFLLEYAITLLRESSLVDALELDSFSVREIDSKRLVQVYPDVDNKLYLSLTRVGNTFEIKVGCDKVAKSGKAIRTNVTAFTASLHFDRSEPADFVDFDNFEQVSISRINGENRVKLTFIGQLFDTRNYDYRWSDENKCLVGYSDMRDTTKYYLGSSADVQLSTPVDALISGIYNLGFYTLLCERPAIPSKIEEVCYYGLPKGRLVLTQIQPGKDEEHVHMTLRNEQDNSLIAEFKNYQLQEFRAR